MIAKTDIRAGTFVSIDGNGNVTPYSDGYSGKERLVRKMGELLRIRKWAKFAEKSLPIGIVVDDCIVSQGIVQVRMG